MDRTVSVVIPHRNEEAAEVDATAQSFIDAGADEVILIHDGDGNGPAWGRNQGAERSTGDVVCFSDAHVRWMEGDFKHFCLLSMRAVMVAPCADMDDPERAAYGADMVEDTEKPGYKLIPVYKPRTRTEALYGSVYAIGKDILKRVGGWPRTRSWGYNEQAMTMAIHAAGVPIYVDASCKILHRFRERFPYSIESPMPMVNRMIAHRMFSDPKEWRERWEPIFRQHRDAWEVFTDDYPVTR